MEALISETLLATFQYRTSEIFPEKYLLVSREPIWTRLEPLRIVDEIARLPLKTPST